MNLDINRSVYKLDPPDEESSDDPRNQFSQFLEVPNIILLGDPGSGKTHTFKAASKEENAKFLSVRQFLATEGLGDDSETYYLDGLDEFRSRFDDKNLVFEVIKLLNRLGRPKFRLSCRAADWLGQTDLSLFKSYFDSQSYAVLKLAPLNENEISTILCKQGIVESEDFINEAIERGLEGLLENPQTLIMLSDVVRQGTWPETKKELYEESIEILLSEPNHERGRKSPEHFGAKELIEAAGAVCTSILISNVDGISLLGNSTHSGFPSYRSIPFENEQKVIACLLRRAFSFVSDEAVTYIHRTIAEFLGAKWLADKIRNGFPIRRVQSLISVEGHPTTELRGLHAWLATLLSDHAGAFIKNDSYGVLKYGDPASLAVPDRKLLLNDLETLSKTDPWFHKNDWSDHPLGALSGQDMVGSFKRILSDSNSSFHLKSIVLGAISNGPILQLLSANLKQIIENSEISYHERSEAIIAMLRAVPDGENKVVNIFRTSLVGGDSNSIRLRTRIIARIYANHFNPKDVYLLFADTLKLSDTNGYTGELLHLAYSLPEAAIPVVLDQLCYLTHVNRDNGKRRYSTDVESAFSQMLSRTLKPSFLYSVDRLWKWLKALYKLNENDFSFNCSPSISDWFIQNKPIVLELFNIAYDELKLPKTQTGWSFYNDFQNITMDSLTGEEMAKHVLGLLRSKTITDKESLLYRILGEIIFLTAPALRDLFGEFLMFAEDHKQLQKIRTKLCQSTIPDWRWKKSAKKLKAQCERDRSREQNCTNLIKQKESIRSGRDLDSLTFLVNVYYARFSDIERKLSPRERLCSEIGEELSVFSFEGFAAILKRPDIPSPKDIANQKAKGKYYPWWYAILAGMDEAWKQKETLSSFPDTLLKTALALTYELPTTYEKKDSNSVDTESTRQWKELLIKDRPDLVEAVFEDLTRVTLRYKKDHVSVLYDLTHKDSTKSWRSKLALKILHEFPSPKQRDLGYLVIAALFNHEFHEELVQIAKEMVYNKGRVKGENRAIWLLIGFLLDFEGFKIHFEKYSKSRDWVFWTVKEFVTDVVNLNEQMKSKLTENHLETIINIFGEKYKNVSRPDGVTVGRKNPWDASRFIEWGIDILSSKTEQNATDALERLSDNPKLDSYKEHLKHALANQLTIRRESEFTQPSWEEVTEALQGGKPANIADLHAFILDHLEGVKTEIRQSNTNTYKAFWRCDSSGAVESPEIEDVCRDRLIEQLKLNLRPLDLRIEPEGHMAANKRADIVILPPPGQKLPLELKRDIHPDLWTACKNQLERLYTRDPEAKGYGIYVVFWFGDQRSGNLPKPPTGIKKPANALELEKALRSLIPVDKRHCLEAVVIDVTPPALPSGKKTTKKKVKPLKTKSISA